MAFINNSYEICMPDLLLNSSVCYLKCPYGRFALPGMLFCHPWLDCGTEINILSLISISVVKAVYLADWEGFHVVASVLTSEVYEKDFLHNLAMIKLYSPNINIINFVGNCKNSIFTEYYELGNALNIPYYLTFFKSYNNFKIRINLCISYVSIIALLHNSYDGVRVMCDSNDLEKALSQYLITPDLRLVINDLDATPKVDILKGGIHCGNKELTGSLLAPEQLWPYPELEFNEKKMPYYDEKTDIYKIPDICNWFLGDSQSADVLKYKMHSIHKKCKNLKPNERPSAEYIIQEYIKIKKMYLI